VGVKPSDLPWGGLVTVKKRKQTLRNTLARNTITKLEQPKYYSEAGQGCGLEGAQGKWVPKGKRVKTETTDRKTGPHATIKDGIRGGETIVN